MNKSENMWRAPGACAFKHSRCLHNLFPAAFNGGSFKRASCYLAYSSECISSWHRFFIRNIEYSSFYGMMPIAFGFCAIDGHTLTLIRQGMRQGKKNPPKTYPVKYCIFLFQANP